MSDSPSDKRETKIAAASKVKAFLNQIGSVTDLNARATIIHDRMSESIQTICSKDGGFSTKQVETLISIAIHISLTFDKQEKNPLGFFKSFIFEFKSASAINKIGFVAVVITILAGVTQIYEQTQDHFYKKTENTKSEITSEDQLGKEKNLLPENSVLVK